MTTAPQPEGPSAERAALAELLKAAREVNRRGATPGRHWTPLHVAMLRAEAALAAPEVPAPVAEPVAPQLCAHDWVIWPETDGQEQRCLLCGSYRPTPESDKFWKKPAPAVSPPPAAQEVPQEVVRDAMRYRWLRVRRPIPLSYPTLPWVIRMHAAPLPLSQECTGAELDAAIDRALASPAAPEGTQEP